MILRLHNSHILCRETGRGEDKNKENTTTQMSETGQACRVSAEDRERKKERKVSLQATGTHQCMRELTGDI